MAKINIVTLVAAIVVCQLAGVLGVIFTIPNIPTWYNTLSKPDFAPPGSLIGVVWILLYTLMGISLYIVWEKGLNKKVVRGAIDAFGVQLILNALWSFLFFGLRSPFYGLLGIILLWLAIVVTIMRFYKVSKNAAWLLVPYILWVSFAGILNFMIWQMNLW